MRSLHFIGSKESGGAERFYARLVRALHEAGQPTLAINPPGSAVARELCDSVPQRHVRHTLLGHQDPLARWRIRRIIREFRPDIVQTYMGRATGPTRLERGKHPVHVARLGGYYNLKNYRHAHAWIGNTRGICDYLIRNDLPAGKVFHIGNFVDEPAPVTPEQLHVLRAHWQIPDDAFIVLSAGRLYPKKGFADLIEAFARLPAEICGQPVYLLIAGDGPLREQLHNTAARLGVEQRTRWAGWRDDLSLFYQAATIFVSASRHEPLGNVILEAWAHSVPVIATRTQGAEELIEHETNALLTPCAQPERLAQTISHLLKANDATRRAMIEQGLQKIRSAYSKPVILNAYLDLYNQLLRER